MVLVAAAGMVAIQLRISDMNLEMLYRVVLVAVVLDILIWSLLILPEIIYKTQVQLLAVMLILIIMLAQDDGEMPVAKITFKQGDSYNLTVQYLQKGTDTVLHDPAYLQS